MDETIEPLLNFKPQTSKKERKSSGNISDTIKLKAIFDFNNQAKKDPKAMKIESKFIFKVYLHILFEVIICLTMIIFSFKIRAFQNLIVSNKIIFYIMLVIAFITLINPFFNDKLLKKYPYNYIYLLAFVLSASYIVCKIVLLFNPNLIKISGILLICELFGLLIYSYINKNEQIDIYYGSSFMLLCLLFIGSIVYFFDKVSIYKLFFIIIFIWIFGIFLIYDMNLIFEEKRRAFEENDYVLATMFIYIDIIQTIFELIGKLYSSLEPERKTKNKYHSQKTMIFIGEEQYVESYQEKNDENKQDQKEDIQTLLKPKKRNSDGNIKKIIKETIQEYDSEKEEDNSNHE
jgi:FtsH-binding integral membrane protein